MKDQWITTVEEIFFNGIIDTHTEATGSTTGPKMGKMDLIQSSK